MKDATISDRYLSAIDRYTQTWKKARWNWAIFIVLAFSLGACGEPPGSYWETVEIELPDGSTITGIVRSWPSPDVAASFEDNVIGAIVADTGVSISIFATQTCEPVLLNSSVDSGHQQLLTDVLLSDELYDPATQTLWFYQTSAPISVDASSTGSVSIVLDGGVIISTGLLIGVATTETDLNDGLPLSNLQVTVDDLSITSTVFRDGFECGNLEAWSATVPGSGAFEARR